MGASLPLPALCAGWPIFTLPPFIQLLWGFQKAEIELLGRFCLFLFVIYFINLFYIFNGKEWEISKFC